MTDKTPIPATFEDGDDLAGWVWDQVGNHQYRLIREAHGVDAAEQCNYGWFVDGSEDETLVTATKVYLAGRILTTTSRVEDGHLVFVSDVWEDR